MQDHHATLLELESNHFRTGADLRKLSMKELESKLLECDFRPEQISKLQRWDRVAAIRQYASNVGSDAGKSSGVVEESSATPLAESSSVDLPSDLPSALPLTSETLLKSAYEQAREDNIKRNNLVLQSLGLLPSSSSTATFATSAGGSSQLAKHNEANKPVKKRKRSGPAPPPTRGSRSSSRLKGEGAAEGNSDLAAAERFIQTAKPPPPTFDMAKYERLLQRHLNQGLVLPPTASYEHTVMRVKTMSEKRLSTRVKVIERAHGSYAVIKMQMFAEVLILEGYEEIAQEADDALQRLLETPKFKGRNWQQMLEIAEAKSGKKKK